MKTISTTNVRKNISEMIDTVRETDGVFLIGRHGSPEAVLIKFPTNFRTDVSDITNVNAYSTSFDFLKDEPDLYSIADIKK
jgi:antitoxin (DNA-binding transcriptional repressor) of toxin-antitoxin stability system